MVTWLHCFTGENGQQAQAVIYTALDIDMQESSYSIQYIHPYLYSTFSPYIL
jgi:hypothetical protein